MRRSAALSLRSLWFGLVVVAASVVLCSCTAAPQPTSTPSATHADAPVVVPSDIPNDPAVRSDVTLVGCAPTTGGGWRAHGVIRNDLADSHRYRITVFFTNRGSTVIGTASTMVTVSSGASKSWQASGAAQPASPTLCVLRGVG